MGKLKIISTDFSEFAQSIQKNGDGRYGNRGLEGAFDIARDNIDISRSIDLAKANAQNGNTQMSMLSDTVDFTITPNTRPASYYSQANPISPFLMNYLLKRGNAEKIAEKVFQPFITPKKTVQIGAISGDEHLILPTAKNLNFALWTQPQYSDKRRYYSYLLDLERRTLGFKVSDIEQKDFNNTPFMTTFEQDRSNFIIEQLSLFQEYITAQLIMDPTKYAAGQVVALAGATCWSNAAGTPVTDIINACKAIKKQIGGKKPNRIIMGYNTSVAIRRNPELLAAINAFWWKNEFFTGVDDVDILKVFSEYMEPGSQIIVGNCVYKNPTTGLFHYIWGDFCTIAYMDNGGMESQGFGQTFKEAGYPFVTAYKLGLDTFYQRVESYAPTVVVPYAGWHYSNCANNGGIF